MVQRSSENVNSEGRQFASEAEMKEAIQAFETGVTRHALWHHAHHLLATCWLVELDPEAALNKLREGILRVNDALGVVNTQDAGYHETITRFWFEIVRREWLQMPRERSFFERANEVVARYESNAGLLYEYYSRGVLRSLEARSRWVPPDLKALPSLKG